MIKKVHWDVVEKDDVKSVVLMIWPAPLEHDACFQRAGFTDFADTDAEWEKDFRDLVERLVSKLCEYGDVTVVNEIESYSGFLDIVPVEEDEESEKTCFLRGMFREQRPRYSLIDQIIISTEHINHYYARDYDFRVIFGDVRLKTGYEHTLFKISLSDKSRVGEIVDFAAGDKDTEEKHLDWSMVGEI